MLQKAQMFRRNYMLLLLEGAFFMGGVGFFSANTVIPVFINHMTGSKLLVGLTISLGSFLTYFCRILIGPYVSHMKNHQRYTSLVMFLCRPVTLVPAVLLFMGFGQVALVALIASYCLMWAADGLVVPTWSEVLATTVDEQRHGRLLGTQLLIGGFVSIGAGLLINWFLSTPTLDLNRAFAYLFLIGGVLMTLSCFMMAFAEGAPHEPKKGRVKLLSYYRDLPRLFVEEKDNSRVMFLQLILSVGLMCLPFIILYAVDTGRLPEGSAGTLVLVQTLGLPLGGWMWGQICDRISVTAGLKLSALNVLLVATVPLIAILLPGDANTLLYILLALTMFLGGVAGGIWTASFLYTVQAVRPKSRPNCLVLGSLVALPATFSSTLAGFVAERFGYLPLFVICVVLALCGLGLSFTVRHVADVVAARGEEVA